MTMTLRDRVSQAISEMDAGLSETDPHWGHAAFLVASFILGPDPQAIADAMEFDPIAVGVWAERARTNGIWDGREDLSQKYAGEEDGVKFWLDCAIIGGSLKKVGDDSYQMTDSGKAEAEKIIKTPAGAQMMKKLKASKKRHR